jgi:ABC-2 type transport system permease protein
MPRLLDAIRLYFTCASISTRAQMQYRASFAMQAVGQMVAMGAELVGVWMLFHRFGTLRGWTLPEVAVLFGMVDSAFALAECFARGFDVLPDLLKTGDFDRVLLRPRSAAFQVAAREIQLMRVGRLGVGMFALVWGASRLGVHWTAARLGLIVAGIAGGACLFAGLFVLQATLAFWTTESLEIVNATTYGGVDMARFPISIYRRWFRRIFIWIIPLAAVNYLPLHAVTGRLDVLGSPTWLQWASPLVGMSFLVICLRVWRLGVRRYTSTGS